MTIKHLKLLLAFFCNISSAFLYAQNQSIFTQLVQVNQEWAYQPDISSKLKAQAAKPVTETQLIQQHLLQTEELLRSRTIHNQTTVQKTNRLKNLDVLHSYTLASTFPYNSNYIGRQPYFIDDNNVYCAAGFLMKESGYNKLARDINKTQNFSYLKDINHPDLMKWIYQSGLTIDELALIQPAYEPDWPYIVEMHYNNTGADVNEYIEFHNPFSNLRCNAIRFYDENNVLYKTVQELDPNIGNFVFNGRSFQYYTFPVGENFADRGIVELSWQVGGSGGTSTYSPIERITYNETQIQVQIFSNPTDTRTFSVGENESTPPNTSITFCGAYRTPTWNALLVPQTIGVANPCLIMSITLKDFSFSTTNKNVILNWQVEPNAKNKQFIIERSGNGNIYSPIGTVNANVAQANYIFVDKNPEFINHYRLKLLETNNKFTYSKVLYVKVEQASILTLLQNTVIDKLSYQISSSHAKNIVVFNIHGQQVYSSLAKQGSGSINTATWATGKYIVRLFTTTGDFYTHQFQKL